MNKPPKKVVPLIGPEQNLPEITLKVLILGVILVIILCAGNAYLGLKVGTTVSASIPAAVISMGVLRFFKRSNVLENNIVQTAASVGEATASGVAFVLPALLLVHYWHYFHFWGTFFIALLGGFMGMLFSIPIRRVLINTPGLRFPEGTAIGAVLKASSKAESDVKPLMFGGLVGGLVNLFQSGFKLLGSYFSAWTTKGGVLFGLGLGFSPALLAAGYIIGINVALSVLIGVVIAWVIGAPILSAAHGLHGLSGLDAAGFIWSHYIRYIGVGTMLVGGLWTIVTLIKPLYDGIKDSFVTLKHEKGTEGGNLPRTERDIPINLVLILISILVVGSFIFLYRGIDAQALQISAVTHVVFAVVGSLFILFGGFLFAAISAYFAGLIGSTNNPASGILVSAIMVFSIITLIIFSIVSKLNHARELELAGFVVMTCALIGPMICIANDTIQDFKAGQIVGATPWKQQVILVLGVIVAALVITPVLQMLFHAYGIGGIFPRPNMPRADMLAAPQAGLMAAVLDGVFKHNLPWPEIITGGLVAVVAIFIDEYLKKRGKRLPVLSIGLGVYLPLASSTPVVIGGLVNYIAHKVLVRRQGEDSMHTKPVRRQMQRTLMLACGMVAGASVMGVVLAIPFAIERNANALSIVGPHFMPIGNVLSIFVTLLICYWLYRTLVKSKSNK